jgi:REP element-mobilizing transposase RayT
MSQSLTKLYAHLIFSTKSRQPFLDDTIRPRVHAYLATTIRNLDSPWVVVGGVADHVHILFDMGKMHARLNSWKWSNGSHPSSSRRSAPITNPSIATRIWNVFGRTGRP